MSTITRCQLLSFQLSRSKPKHMESILNVNPVYPVPGIAVGHVYFFLEDVYAVPVVQGGMGGPQVLKTPAFMCVPAPSFAEPCIRVRGGFCGVDKVCVCVRVYVRVCVRVCCAVTYMLHR